MDWTYFEVSFLKTLQYFARFYGPWSHNGDLTRFSLILTINLILGAMKNIYFIYNYRDFSTSILPQKSTQVQIPEKARKQKWD